MVLELSAPFIVVLPVAQRVHFRAHHVVGYGNNKKTDRWEAYYTN